MDYYLLFLLMPIAVLGLVPSAIASLKGCSAGKWYLYGILVFPVALVHSILLDSRKTCPHCKERVMVDAIVCPFCRSTV